MAQDAAAVRPLKIVYIAAGAGPMYCGACARDIALVRALMERGHDVTVVPLYTPLRVDGSKPVETEPVFLGGINAYLQQKSGLFRRLPPALDRFLDNPTLLRWVSRFAISTAPSKLGDMTVSVLAGQQGNQAKEVDRLLEFLEAMGAPDAFVITNTLLTGIAPTLKARFHAPVLCGIQGEDVFVDSLGSPHRERAYEHMRRNAESIDLFLSPGDSYADLMADLLQVGRERFRTVRAGISTAEHRRPGPRVREPFTLGYLSVICRPKGLDILVDAWRKLVGEGREVVLRVAGRVMDPRYWRQVERSITATRGGRFEILGEVDFPGKISFLHSCSAFSVPSRQRETRGMAVLEALAAGVPVVAPDAGVYPEMLSLAPGGILVPGENPDALAAALARLMDDPDEADALGEAGARGVAENHEASVVVDAMLAALDEVRARKPDQQVS